MNRKLILATSAMLSLAASAEDASHAYQYSVAKKIPAVVTPITITINPEARVSVTLTGALPPRQMCGNALEVPVAIINQGGITSPLDVRLMEPVPAGVQLAFSSEPLTGIAKEARVLLLVPPPKAVDVTLIFSARHQIPNLVGLDHIHFIIQCVEDSATPGVQ